MKLNITHIRAQEVSNSAHAADWATPSPTGDFLVDKAREGLVQLLSGEPAGTEVSACRAALIDLIGAAIVNSNDIDATPESQAEAVLNDILNSCLPLPQSAA